MNTIVWLVWEEGGEYDGWYRNLRGVFSAEPVAKDFAAELRGGLEKNDDAEIEVEEHELLSEKPVEIMEYRWADHVTLSGKLSPEQDSLGSPFRAGRHRGTRQVWKHEACVFVSEASGWIAREIQTDGYVSVTGTDKAQVIAEHGRLVKEVRAKIKVHIQKTSLGGEHD
jgi:hypothetical protein